MWTIRILPAATHELERLDKPLARRVVARIRWLAENLAVIQLKPLKGELSGLYSLREGDYRIIYQILRQETTILIHSIGHRRSVYRQK
jgi:mRNA interferase RelE/StbE